MKTLAGSSKLAFDLCDALCAQDNISFVQNHRCLLHDNVICIVQGMLGCRHDTYHVD